MKRILSISLAILMILSVVALTSCGEKTPVAGSTAPAETNAPAETTAPVVEAATLKFGVGIANSVAKATDAEDEKNGVGELDASVAAVLVDADGKVVKCVIDCAQYAVEYTADGEAVEKEDFRTKYEKGNDYGMSAIGKAEWYVQIDALASVVVGKTLDEVKALVVDGYKGTDEVINAGCTVGVADYVSAVVKAIESASDSAATADCTLKIGVAGEQSMKDADGDVAGQNQVEATIVASAVGADGKVVATYADAVQVKFTFDEEGTSTYDTTKEVLTKKELGNNYGMSSIGKAEWFEQAAAFEASTIGKTAAEIAGLEKDGYGVEAVQTAGCTIAVTDLVKAAVKAATIG